MNHSSFALWDVNFRLRVAERIIYWGLITQIIVLPLDHTQTILTLATIIPLGALIHNLIFGLTRPRQTPLDLGFGLFFLAGLVSVVFSVDPLETLDEVRSDILIPTLTFYLAAWGLADRAGLTGLCRGAAVCAAVLAGFGLGHFILAGGSLMSWDYREASLTRDFHYFATYLILAAPLVLMVAWKDENPSWRWLGRAVLALVPWGVYISHDRGCWLALGFMALLLYPVLSRRWRRLYLAGLVLVAVAGLIVLPRQVIMHFRPQSITGSVYFLQDNFRFRIFLWSFCLKAIKESPFQGIGFGRHNFKLAFPEFYRKYQQYLMWHCHNSYLDLAVQLGLPGLAAFLYLVGRAMGAAFGLWRRAGPLRRFGLAGIMLLGGYLLRIFWDSFYVGEHVRLLWLVFGLIYAATRLESETAEASGSPPRP